MIHTADLVIGPEHIDQYRHVNYKGIPALLEPFQDTLLARAGTSFDDIEKRFGLRSFVKKMEITWSGELKEGDVCGIVSALTLGNTSMTFRQEIYEATRSSFGKPEVQLVMVVVMVNSADVPTLIPEELRDLFLIVSSID